MLPFPRGLALLALILGTGPIVAQETTAPLPRRDDPLWMKRHELLRQRAQKGPAEVVFLGDALTQGWEGLGQEAWKKQFEPLKAINLGSGGDRIENVLWRITEGQELGGLKPRVVVVLVGGNNLPRNSAAEIVTGVEALVKAVTRAHPQARIVLTGLLPRGSRPSDKYRAKIAEVNKGLARLDGGLVRYLDIGPRFLDSKGEIPAELMPDGQHLSARGYQSWAEALRPVLDELLSRRS
jgi:lysophospholipase L1-like esterase